MNFMYNLYSSGKSTALVMTVLTLVKVVCEDSLDEVRHNYLALAP